VLLEQLKYFPMAANDDGPDSLEACRTLAKASGTFGFRTAQRL